MKTALILINLLITFTHEAIIIIQNKLRSYSFLQVPIIINHSDIHNLEQANIQEGVIAGISSDSLVTFFDQSNSINSPVFIFDHSDDRKINNQSISITDYTNMRQFQGYIVNSGRNNVSQISQDSIDINLKYIYRDIKMEWIKNTAFSYVFENHYLHTNLNEFDFLLKIFCEGSQVLKKDLGQIDLLPGENKLFNFSLDIDLRPGQVYEFRTTAKLKEDKVWAKRGHIVSEERTLIKKETNGKLIKILD